MQNTNNNKLRWLDAKNTNYLSAEDLPHSKDVILEILSAKMEKIVNPKTKEKSDSEKLVVRFVKTEENKNWIKPFVCNVTNAKAITKMTNTYYVEEAVGKKIKLGVDNNIKLAGQLVDGLRVRTNITSDQLECGLLEDQQSKIMDLIIQSQGTVTLDIIINAYKVKHLSNIPSIHFEKICKGIESRISQVTEKQKDLI